MNIYFSSTLQKIEGKNQAQRPNGLNVSKKKYFNSGYLQNSWQFLNYLFVKSYDSEKKEQKC